MNLFDAIYVNDVKTAERLLASGANVNVVNDVSETPLHAACLRGQIKIAQVLIAAGADVNAVNDTNNETPIHYACSCENIELISLLLAAGANVNCLSEHNPKYPCNWPFFHQICHDEKIVSLFIEAGANVNITTTSGWSLLYWVCQLGHVKVVSLLLAAGADIHHATDGKTPLYAACYNRHPEIVSLLIEAGANPFIKFVDNYGNKLDDNIATQLTLAQHRVFEAFLLISCESNAFFDQSHFDPNTLSVIFSFLHAQK